MLKAALNRAFHHGRVTSDSAWRKVKPFKKVDEARIRYLNPDEVRRLVNACPADLRRLVQGAVLTGCRYSELARPTVGDFNADSGTLNIRLAKGRVRHVTLTAEGLACLSSWVAGRLATEQVFLRADGKPWGHPSSGGPFRR